MRNTGNARSVQSEGGAFFHKRTLEPEGAEQTACGGIKGRRLHIRNQCERTWIKRHEGSVFAISPCGYEGAEDTRHAARFQSSKLTNRMSLLRSDENWVISLTELDVPAGTSGCPIPLSAIITHKPKQPNHSVAVD